MEKTIRIDCERTACSMGVLGSAPLRITSSSCRNKAHEEKRHGEKIVAFELEQHGMHAAVGRREAQTRTKTKRRMFRQCSEKRWVGSRAVPAHSRTDVLLVSCVTL